MPKERVVFVFRIVCEHFADVFGVGVRGLEAFQNGIFNVGFRSDFRDLFDLVTERSKAPY